ncbi:MAG: hypothetical protein HY017_09100 [Betaproteobacteria bacterium]|nr:hypothetical protein [Betaproteobacteria bacterium]
MGTDTLDQQPIARTVGRRLTLPVGRPPSAAARAALAAMAAKLTRTPKGVIRYANHDDMIRDRERWTVEAMVALARSRG